MTAYMTEFIVGLLAMAALFVWVGRGKLSVFDKCQQIKRSSNHFFGRVDMGNNSFIVSLTVFKVSKKAVYCGLVLTGFFIGHVKAQFSEVIFSDVRQVLLPVPAVVQKFIQFQEQRFSYGVKSLNSVSGKSFFVAVPDTGKEANQTNNGSNDRTVITKHLHEHRHPLASDEAVMISMIVQLLLFPLSFFLGVHFSTRGSLGKLSTLGFISIFSISDRIKTRRWLLWDLRQRFLDEKSSIDFDTAYHRAKFRIRQQQREKAWKKHASCCVMNEYDKT